MPRGLTSGMQAAVAGSHVPLAILVELAFPSGTVRLSSAAHAITWGGNAWLGAGGISALEPVAESVVPGAQVLNLRFSGIDPAYLSAVLDDDYQGQSAKVWLAAFDDELRIVANPYLVGEYRMDAPVVSCGTTVAVQLALENRFADWDRPRLRRYNHADQQAAHPGDMAFEYLESLQNASIVWGIFKGPVAPDPLKTFNRTLDKVVGGKVFGIPILPGAKELVVDPLRAAGDFLAPAANKVRKFLGF